MKNKNAKYIIEKLEQWFHDLIDCTATFEYIKKQYVRNTNEDKKEINLNTYELLDLFDKMINCACHIDILKNEIRAVLNMMQFWYGTKNERR